MKFIAHRDDRMQLALPPFPSPATTTRVIEIEAIESNSYSLHIYYRNLLLLLFFLLLHATACISLCIFLEYYFM